eukprot:COSAG06_NODE_5148_length_3679_cov_9.779050_4_plen_341_part_00
MAWISETFGDPLHDVDNEHSGLLFAGLGTARLSVLTGVDLSSGDVIVNRVESKATEATPPGFQHENHPFAVTSYIDNPKSGSGVLSERERQHRMNHGWMCGFDYTNLRRSPYDPVKTYKDIQAFWTSFEVCDLKTHPVCTRALRDELRGGVDELSVANRDDDDVKAVSEAMQRHIHYQLMPDANGEGDGGAVRRHLDSPTEAGRIIHFCHVLQVTTLMVRHHELQATFALMDATEGTMWSFGFASVTGAAFRSSVNGYSPHYAHAPRGEATLLRITAPSTNSTSLKFSIALPYTRWSGGHKQRTTLSRLPTATRKLRNCWTHTVFSWKNVSKEARTSWTG